MSGILVGELILWLIVAIIVIVVGVYIVNWLYHRSSKEVSFVRTGFAGERVELPDPQSGDGTIEWAIDQYEQTWRMVDALVAREPSLDAVCRNVDTGSNVNLRWILAHLLEEVARHAGHADIIRELIDGQTGR